MLDFNRIKEIKLTDVVARYKIALRFKADYAVCACPLPTHKQGDTGKSFSINLAGNYWRCFSDSCNANNGGKRGGDVINFVALMENCREKDAAQKLSDWYGIQSAKFVSKPGGDVYKQSKTPQHMAEASKGRPKTEMQSSNQNPSTSGDSVKYMALVDAWYDQAAIRLLDESDEEYRMRFLKGLKKMLLESYRAGQKARS